MVTPKGIFLVGREKQDPKQKGAKAMEVEVISRKIPFDKLQSVSYIRYMLISIQRNLNVFTFINFLIFYLLYSIVIGFIVNQTR